jgi:hypothetical protein
MKTMPSGQMLSIEDAFAGGEALKKSDRVSKQRMSDFKQNIFIAGFLIESYQYAVSIADPKPS